MEKRENKHLNNTYKLKRKSLKTKDNKRLHNILKKITNNRTLIKFLAGTITICSIGGIIYSSAKIPTIKELASTVIEYNKDHLYVDELMDTKTVQDYIKLCDSIEIFELVDNVKINYNKVYSTLSASEINRLNNYTVADTKMLIDLYEKNNQEIAAKLYYLRNYNYNYIMDKGNSILERFLLLYIKSSVAYSLDVKPTEVDYMTIPAHHNTFKPEDEMRVNYNDTTYKLEDELYRLCIDLYNVQTTKNPNYDDIKELTNKINYYMFFEPVYSEKTHFIGNNENVINLNNNKQYYKEFKKGK